MTLHLSLYYLSLHLFEIQTFFSCFAMALKILNRPTCILKEVWKEGVIIHKGRVLRHL